MLVPSCLGVSRAGHDRLPFHYRSMTGEYNPAQTSTQGRTDIQRGTLVDSSSISTAPRVNSPIYLFNLLAE